jgi:GNAT superfamily N-acetyltransferase
MLSPRYVIRNLREEEMKQIVDMAAAEGWNPGLADGGPFFAADNAGFFVGLLDSVPISFISAVNYNREYGFVGLYIVRSEFRGQGYGYALWQHALEKLGTIPCGLDGVPAQIENYRKSGFTYAFRQMRLATTAIHSPFVPEKVYPITSANVEALYRYDAQVFGTERRAFMASWLSMPNAKAFYSEENGVFNGYAVIRRCGDGHKIGPLFADNATVAERLFLACHRVAGPEEMVYVDMPELNEGAQDMARRYQLQLVFETARMYKGGTPEFPLEKVYGVTSFELG